MWQHWLYYPVMVFARFNLYVQSILYLMGPEKKEYPILQRATIGVFWAGAFAVFRCFETWRGFLGWVITTLGLLSRVYPAEVRRQQFL